MNDYLLGTDMMSEDYELLGHLHEVLGVDTIPLAVPAGSPAKTITTVNATQMAIDQSKAADTPNEVKAAAASTAAAAEQAAPPPPPVVKEKAKALKKAAAEAKTPEEVKKVKEQVKEVAVEVHNAAVPWLQRQTVGGLKYWQIGGLGIGGAGLLGGLLALLFRRRK